MSIQVPLNIAQCFCGWLNFVLKFHIGTIVFSYSLVFAALIHIELKRYRLTVLQKIIVILLTCVLYNFFSFEQYVEKLELIGMDFIWKIAMESPDEEIANEAIQLIINYSYINLNPRLKKVGIQEKILIHKMPENYVFFIISWHVWRLAFLF